MREWLRQNTFKIEELDKEKHRTIAQIIREQNIVELSDKTEISIKRVNELAKG